MLGTISMGISDNMVDWNAFSTPTLQKEMRFKAEIFNDVLNMVWEEYVKENDDSIFVAVFLALIEDFPNLKELFDNYYESLRVDDYDSVWSDKKIILRFFTKLYIIYENLEVQTTGI